MHLVPDPTTAPFGRVAGIDVIRGVDEQGGRGRIAGVTPADAPTLGRMVLLDPDPTQNLDGRQRTCVRWSVGRIDGLEQLHAVSPDGSGEGSALGLPGGQAVLFEAQAVAVKPLR